MELTADEQDGGTEAPARTRGPAGWLLLGALGLLGLGGWTATRSIGALLARTEQLERAAAESEARVAELQTLRDAMNRRLRGLEQRQREESARRLATVRRGSETGVALARREAARPVLESLLQPETQRGTAFLEGTDAELRVELADALLFSPRGAALTPEGAALLSRVGAQLAVEGHLLQVEVYTDALPEALAAAGPAPTSWELSAARAVAVTRYLAETAKLPAERLVAMGHGPRPVTAGHEEAPAAVSPRRVELRLVPAPLASHARRGPAPG